MDLQTKVNTVSQLLYKALDDINYKLQVDWNELTPGEIKTYLENCRKYMQTMDRLDYDVRQKGIANWNAKMDELLSMFPEYQHLNEEENTKA